MRSLAQKGDIGGSRTCDDHLRVVRVLQHARDIDADYFSWITGICISQRPDLLFWRTNNPVHRQLIVMFRMSGFDLRFTGAAGGNTRSGLWWIGHELI